METKRLQVRRSEENYNGQKGWFIAAGFRIQPQALCQVRSGRRRYSDRLVRGAFLQRSLKLLPRRKGILTAISSVSWPSVEPSKDAKTWIFKLHNGKSLNAGDVIASLNHHRGAGSKSGAKDVVKAVEEIRLDGSGIVIISLKEPSVDFQYLLEHYQLPILPAKDGKHDLSGVCCSGYVLGNIDYKRLWEQDAMSFGICRRSQQCGGAISIKGPSTIRSATSIRAAGEMPISEHRRNGPKSYVGGYDSRFTLSAGKRSRHRATRSRRGTEA
ncbi:hypothetical protein [Mesorhizobium sp. SARCC-RB16n]|uniref:hypothetical protein n=1 Tax=Mesorhizobium sp. SARCC-RB16n TaxID=2116687 RepID=UPI001663F3AE|nr:hypothetical protein [Mesorhizobium sp. SARCC-RB16n]